MFGGNVNISSSVTLIRAGDMDSNIYVINKELLVDSGTGLDSKAMSQTFNSTGISLDGIRRVVLTHAHFDHAGGISLFKNAKVCIHRSDAKVIESGDRDGSAAAAFYARIKPRKVDLKLEDGDIVKAGDITLKVIHTPGHTKGSICLYDGKNRTLFSGDTVFADGFGRVDLPGGSLGDMKRSLDRLSRLDVDKILPGHGEVVWSGGRDVIRNLLPDE